MGAWDFIRPHLLEVVGGRPVRAHRAAAQREPGGRIGGAPRAQSAGARRRRRSADAAPAKPRRAARSATATAQLTSSQDQRSTSSRLSASRSGSEQSMPANIVVPEVGESIVDARVAKWLKKEGDAVARRRPARRARDRQDRSRGRGAAGRRAEPDRSHRTARTSRSARCSASSRSAAPARSRRPRRRQPAPSRAAAPAAGRASAEPATAAAEEPRATPTARNAARGSTKSISRSVRGSGDAGRVMRRDVEQAARGNGRRAPRRRRPPPAPPAPQASPAPPVAEDRRVRRRSHRRARAHVEAPRDDRPRLVEAQSTAAMLTTFNEVDMTGGDGAARAPQAGVQGAPRRRPRHRVVLRQGRRSARCARSRGSTPRSRATRWCSSTTTTSASPSAPSEGLVVPVLRDADRMSFAEIEQQIRDFAKRARGRHAVARRSEGRHVHDHQRRRVRLAAEHADPEPAAGRHPRAAQDPGSPGRRQRPGRRSGR